MWVLLTSYFLVLCHVCNGYYSSAQSSYGYQGFRGYQANQPPATNAAYSPPSYSSNPSSQYLYVLTGKRQVVSSRILPGNTPIPPSLPTYTYNGPLNGPRVTIYRKILRPVRIHYQYWIYPNGNPSVTSQWVGK